MRRPRLTKDGWLIVVFILFTIGIFASVLLPNNEQCTQVNVHLESGQINAEVCQ